MVSGSVIARCRRAAAPEPRCRLRAARRAPPRQRRRPRCDPSPGLGPPLQHVVVAEQFQELAAAADGKIAHSGEPDARRAARLSAFRAYALYYGCAYAGGRRAQREDEPRGCLSSAAHRAASHVELTAARPCPRSAPAGQRRHERLTIPVRTVAAGQAREALERARAQNGRPRILRGPSPGCLGARRLRVSRPSIGIGANRPSATANALTMPRPSPRASHEDEEPETAATTKPTRSSLMMTTGHCRSPQARPSSGSLTLSPKRSRSSGRTTWPCP